MATVFRGSRRLIDAATGEIHEVQVVDKTVNVDGGFHKFWVSQILELVDEVGNAKMRVLMWLLSQADSQNQILATWAEIAEATGVSRRTVASLMSVLKASNIVTETRRSLWRLNPEVIFQGDHSKRMSVLIKFRNEAQGDLFEGASVEPLFPEKDAPVVRPVRGKVANIR